MERFEDNTYVADPILEQTEEFSITDAKTADWAIGKIAEERKRRDFFVECAKAEIEKLNNQIKDAEQKCENATNYLASWDNFLNLTKCQKQRQRPNGQ